MTDPSLRTSSKLSIAGVLILLLIGPVFVVKSPPFFTPLDFYGKTVPEAEYNVTRANLDERERGIVLHHADA